MRRRAQLSGLSKQEMSYVYFNENPAGRSVGDCAVRAVSKALGKTWEEAYVELALENADKPIKILF